MSSAAAHPESCKPPGKEGQGAGGSAHCSWRYKWTCACGLHGCGFSPSHYFAEANSWGFFPFLSSLHAYSTDTLVLPFCCNMGFVSFTSTSRHWSPSHEPWAFVEPWCPLSIQSCPCISAPSCACFNLCLVCLLFSVCSWHSKYRGGAELQWGSLSAVILRLRLASLLKQKTQKCYVCGFKWCPRYQESTRSLWLVSTSIIEFGFTGNYEGFQELYLALNYFKC